MSEHGSNFRTAFLWLILIAAGAGQWACVGTWPWPPHSSTPSTALELKVERAEGKLVLKWNREAEVVRNVQQATLTITDGNHTEEVPLDMGQLKGGSVIYAPITSDVSFRLDVVSRKGESKSETVRFMPARRPSAGGNTMPDQSIGTATMTSDGTIILDLRATAAGGTIGDARFVYPKNHKQYSEVLKHLGGLKPGESKPVPPWPDER